MRGAVAVEPEGDAWTEEGDQLLAEEHLRGAFAIRGRQWQVGRVEEAQWRCIPRSPSHRHRNGPGPSPNSLGEVTPAAGAAVEVEAADAAARREVGDDACVAEGAVVGRGVDAMARCVKWAGGPGFRTGPGVAVAHCVVAVPVQNSSCHCVMECREVAEV